MQRAQIPFRLEQSIQVSEDTTQALSARRITRQSPVIMELPPEILTRIAMLLNCKELLEMRKTCKLFHTVTHTRQIWINLLERLQATYRICPPEDHTENYTTAELQEWVLRRELSRRVLSGSVQAKPKARVISKSKGWEGPASERHILPGGRWLLVQNICSTYAVDLDFPNRDPIPLFELCDMVPPFDGNTFQDTIWVDRSMSPWRYRIAVAIQSGRGISQVHIFQLETRGHGPTATLVPERLTSFRAGVHHHSCSFNKNYFFGFATEIKLFHYSPTIGQSTDALEIEPLTYLLQEDEAYKFPQGLGIINETLFTARVYHVFNFYVMKVICDQDTHTPHSIQLLYKICYYTALGPKPSLYHHGFQMIWMLRLGEFEHFLLPDDKTRPTISRIGVMDLDTLGEIFKGNGTIALSMFSSIAFDQSFIEIMDLSNCHQSWNLEEPLPSYRVPFHFPVKLDRRPALLAYVEDIGRVMFCYGEEWIFIDLI